MRSTVLITLAVLAGLAVLPAVAEDAQAYGPAEIYFFDQNACVYQRYCIPGNPIGQLPELPVWADGWATAEGEIVENTTKFGEGSHIVVAYKGTPTPIVPPAPPIIDETGILAIIVVVILAGCGIYAWIWYRRMKRRY